ncbi:MAG: permease-like cell division protein FtsX [Clostridia bacterium]|nr:permease-like cell division protein FtsX [Clostridia bacterium]
MAFRGLKYYCSEAFKNIWYNKLMAITSIITVMSCLLIFGFFLVVQLNLNDITKQLEGQCEIQAFMPQEYNDEQAKQVCDKISVLPNVKSAILETRQQAYDNYKDTLGTAANVMENINPEEFLPASCKIRPNDISQLNELEAQVSAIEGVEEVINRRDTVNGVISVNSIIRNGCIIFAVLLALIAVFIISNTIKLDVHARQREIHIMKYVGATDWFIRWPFIIEGIIVGFLGAVVAILITLLISSLLLNALDSFGNIFQFRSSSDTMPLVSVVLLLFGVVIGALGSLVAVRKHLQV